jgi:hypothetical protein
LRRLVERFGELPLYKCKPKRQTHRRKEIALIITGMHEHRHVDLAWIAHTLYSIGGFPSVS